MQGPRVDVCALPLAPSLRSKLQSAGFRTTADLGIGPVDLAREADITPEEAVLTLKASKIRVQANGTLQGALSAAELLQKEHTAKRVITFCGPLDDILGGGITSSQLTEFCGAPAVGKTQLGTQLSIDVQIPRSFGGLQGQAIYIDTEGSFVSERVAQIADACIKHLRRIAASSGDAAQAQDAGALTRQHLLNNIFYYRVHDYVEQIAVIQGLQDLIQQHQQIKIIVIDSITFHFRQEMQDMGQRTRILAQMAQNLMRIAESWDLAVVMMNQVTTKILEDDQSKLVPALGDSWAHAATNRVILYWQEQCRYAYLYKSPSLPARTAEFVVTAEGVRGRRPPKRARDS